ncbi:hypothetical protein R6Q57_025416 [Mikania cordata]
MADAMEPGRVTFDDKMVVRKAIEDAKIPFTYVSGNCFAGYFVGGLCQFGHILPSKDSVVLYGDGNQKCPRHVFALNNMFHVDQRFYHSEFLDCEFPLEWWASCINSVSRT